MSKEKHTQNKRKVSMPKSGNSGLQSSASELNISKSRLRKKAGLTLRGRDENVKTLSPREYDELVRELQVHQIELEMRNEKLRATLADLEESRSYYADLYEFAPVGYFTFDKNGRIHAVNRTGCDLLQMERDDLIHKPLSQFMHKDDQDIFNSHRGKVLREHSRQAFAIRLRRKSGALVHARLQCLPVKSKDGYSHIRAAVIDITDQKQAADSPPMSQGRLPFTTRATNDSFKTSGVRETGTIRDIKKHERAEKKLINQEEHHMELLEKRTAELRASYKKMELEMSERKLAEEKAKSMALFAELNPSPVLRFDLDGTVLMANPSAVKLFGREPLTGAPVRAVIPGIEAYNLNDCIRNGSLLSHSAQIGNQFFHFIFKGIPDMGVGQIYGTNVTDQKRAEAETMRASHLASLGELAAGVAHEINNPVNGIMNYTQIIANKSDPGSQEHEIANRIIKESGRIAGIVRSLLSFARDSSDDKHPVGIHEIIADTLALTELQLKKEGIQLKVCIPGNIPAIIAQPRQLEQVFLNLVSNARYALNQKYSGSHKDKVLEISAERVTINNKPWIRVIFHDRGIGIPDAIAGKIMNPFFTTKQGDSGTGLGLSISHGIISDHGGKLIIESIEGEFTKVMITLPCIETRK